jgi:putative SbcD/Mre11-related phosphoesterase
MELFDKFRIIEPQPALYAPGKDAVIVSDLHIGIEAVEARTGTLMPKFQMEEILDELETMRDETGADRLVIVGDIKHSFSGTNEREREEVERFLDKISLLFETVWLIEGNHDNALTYRIDDYTNVELDDHFAEDGVLFVHGHEKLEDLEELTADIVVIGHEHPAIVLTDDVGITEKIACFLYGDMKDGRKIIVLPAFSRLASGTEVNKVPEHELLSPILREQVDIDALDVVAVDREAGMFDFPAVGKLRDV